jgi:membrane protein implicated in regulation of membrane protease activity
VARWIFQFRSSGERPLTEDERTKLKQSANGMRLRRLGFALTSVASFFGAFVCLAIAAGNQPAVWAGVVIGIVFALWVLGFASAAEKRALLYRRALRLGTVERFERVTGDTTVRTRWNAAHECEDGYVELRPMGEYWQQEEGFEESLARSAGRNPDWFEAVSIDGVVLWVEGKLTKAFLEPFVWEV